MDPNDRTAIIQEIIEKGFASSITVNLLKKNGKKISVSLTAAALKDDKGDTIGMQGTLFKKV